MIQFLSRTPALIYFAGTVAALALCGWNYHNGSYDMGLHYSLVAFIADHNHLPDCNNPADIYLSEFCFYPPIAHIAAASIGQLAGSAFLGMHLLTIAAVYICYLALFAMVRFRDNALSLAVLGGFIVLGLIFQSRTFFFGAEVRANYFFAQLIGNACLLAFLALQSRPGFIASLLAIILFGWLYAMCAVQLAAIIIVWLLLERAPIIKILGFAVLAGASIYFHPIFRQSIALGSNPGDIYTGWIPSWGILPMIAALAMCAGLLAIETWRGKLLLSNANRLIAVALGVAAAASLQALAYYLLGSGSEYIVRKHAYALGTLLAACSMVLSVHYARARLTFGIRPIILQSVYVVGGVILTATVLKPGRDSRTLEMIAAERRARIDGASVASMKPGHDRFALDMGINRRPKADAFADNLRK